MGKWICVDFEICHPKTCDPEKGICRASKSCTHKLLIQEELFDEPMLLSSKMCIGCGDCVLECPFRAIEVLQGF